MTAETTGDGCEDVAGHGASADGVLARRVTLGAAVRDGGMTVAAPRWLVRELNVWGRLSTFAGVIPVRA
jgi:hypothetical protein